MLFCLEVWHIYGHSFGSSKICQDPIKLNPGSLTVVLAQWNHELTSIKYHEFITVVSRRESNSHGPNERRVWMFGCKVVNLLPCWLILSRVAGNLHRCETWRGLSEMGASYCDVGPIPHPREKLRNYSVLLIAQFSSINHIMALYIPGSSLIQSAYTLVQATIVFFFFWVRGGWRTFIYYWSIVDL